MEFVQKIVHSIRSALSDYNVPKSSKTETYIQCSDEITLEIATKFKEEITTFANCSKVELVDSSCMPTGCAILSISDKCQVHLLLKVSFNFTNSLRIGLCIDIYFFNLGID